MVGGGGGIRGGGWRWQKIAACNIGWVLIFWWWLYLYCSEPLQFIVSQHLQEQLHSVGSVSPPEWALGELRHGPSNDARHAKQTATVVNVTRCWRLARTCRRRFVFDWYWHHYGPCHRCWNTDDSHHGGIISMAELPEARWCMTAETKSLQFCVTSGWRFLRCWQDNVYIAVSWTSECVTPGRPQTTAIKLKGGGGGGGGGGGQQPISEPHTELCGSGGRILSSGNQTSSCKIPNQGWSPQREEMITPFCAISKHWFTTSFLLPLPYLTTP